MKSAVVLAIVIGCTMAYSAPAAGLKFQPLGELAHGFSAVNAYGVSNDGGVVVGWGIDSSDVSHSFRLSADGELMVFDSFEARNVSGDGRVVVGKGSVRIGPYGSAQWSMSDGEESLAGPPANFEYGIANGVSHDGSVIVGTGHSSGTTEKPYRWTESTGMTSLGQVPGKPTGIAHAVSGDGSTVVGYGYRGGIADEEAFRWTAANGLQRLGYLPGKAQRSYAVAASFDGSIVVGSSESAAGREAFRWTSSDGMKSLGDLSGGAVDSFATDVTDDGSIVIGCATSEDFRGAVFWNSAGKIRSLKDYLVSRGVTGLDDWTLWVPNAISADGRTIVGEGFGPRGVFEAWIVTIPEPSAAALMLPVCMAFGRMATRRPIYAGNVWRI